MKKLLTLVLAVLLIAGLATVASAAEKGAEVEVPVTVSGNPGFGCYTVALSYDKEALQLVALSDAGCLTAGKGSFFPSVDTDRASFFVNTLNDVEGDGTLFVATFKIKETAVEGETYKVDASFVAGSVANAKDEDVSMNIKGGSVYVDKHECAWGEWETIKAADCVNAGEKVRVCSICGEKEYAVIPALGHNYVAVVTAPTCTEDGYTTYTCSVCGDSYVADKVDALGHDYVAVVTAPTCTEDGYTTYTCSVCGDSYVDDVVDALGHKFVWKFVDEENHQQVCTACGHRGIVEPHVFGDDTICDKCGYDKGMDPVPPTGDITAVIVTSAFAVVAAVAAAGYMLKRKFNV